MTMFLISVNRDEPQNRRKCYPYGRGSPTLLTTTSTNTTSSPAQVRKSILVLRVTATSQYTKTQPVSKDTLTDIRIWARLGLSQV